MNFRYNPLLGNTMIPVDIVMAPEWWNKQAGITFDPDFFYHPLKRVEDEQKMEKLLYDRWGRFGLGRNSSEARPEIGAVHLAAGYLLSEMLGCRIDFSDAHPPQVFAARSENLDICPEDAFRSPAFKKVLELAESLKTRFGFVTGDINWGGILNIAMDLRGEDIFTDMMMSPEEVRTFFNGIARVIETFTDYLQSETGSTSVSVNRVVHHLRKPVLLHSECSHTMISEEDYENYLLPWDVEWSKKRPFGIHYCGSDPHRMASGFARIPHLDFLDLGWGGNVKELRTWLPDTFLNIRLSPVEMARSTPDEIRQTVTRLVHESGNPFLTGICCINMDGTVPDSNVTAIFETAEELRREYSLI
jgi:hypothetical protein